EPESLLRGALALELLLHAAASFLLIGLFRRYTSPGVALVGGLCWLANPLAIFLAFQGVEAALYALCLVLLLRVAARFAEAPDRAAPLPHVLLGGALALCFLARTEAGILAAVTCAVAPALRGERPWSRSGLRSAFLIGAAFTLCILPWFVFCWFATGTPWQTSGVMKALWANHFMGEMSVGQRVGRAATLVGRFWLASPWLRTLGSPFEGINTFAWAGMLPAAVGLLLAARRAEDRPLILWSAWLLGTTILTGAVYGLFYWDIQVWYRAQPAILLFVLSFVWIARTGTALAGRWRLVFRTVVPLLLLALSLREAWSFFDHPPIIYPWQRDFHSSQAEFEKLVPPGEAIGCFNAGIPAFFSERRVVNLDGLVNGSVVPYYRAGELDRYFRDEKIRYIADEPYSLHRSERFMRQPLSLRPLAAAPLRGWFTPQRVLWEVNLDAIPDSRAE
ncbi:MAG TPA: hypothetical protein VJ885_10620, partial [Thermoanaerobaculia bacterium]|nr:hypothetical protein [Thermoanaerobaculia bacterium]